jgi:hypothetical protein
VPSPQDLGSLLRAHAPLQRVEDPLAEQEQACFAMLLSFDEFQPGYLSPDPRDAQRDEESREDGPVTQLEEVLLSLIGKGQANPIERQRSKRGPRIET